jgi:hypothetical protein
MTKGYNLPDNISPNNPDAPWNKKEKVRTWVIKNTVTGGYWSTLFGWVEEEPITLFSDEEKNGFPYMAIDGEWELFDEEEI